MRILLVTPYFYPHKGGSQQYAQALYATWMKSDKNITVDVICYNTAKKKSIEIYDGFVIYRIPCIEILPGQFALPNYFILWNVLKKLFKKNSYAFINTHTRFFESAWWTPFIAKYFHTKSVLTDHCADHPRHSSLMISWIAKWIDKIISPLLFPNYDLVTVTNKATQAFLVSLGCKNPELVYGGVDTRFFSTNRKNASKKIPHIKKPFHKTDIIITFLGRMIYSKGPQILLECAKTIIEKHPNVRILFAGNGELFMSLKAQKNPHTFFLGELETLEIKELLAHTDILVHPSLHHEGFPNVLLEAGASGCCVIATNIGGTNEIIEQNKTGIFVEPTRESVSEAIEILVRDTKKRLQLGINLRKKVRSEYDWKKIVQIYKHTIDKKLGI